MDINITTDELALLAWLREHATGFSEYDRLQGDDIQLSMTELELTQIDFRKQATYLQSFALVSTEEISGYSRGDPGPKIVGIGITGAGENFLRQLAAELEKNEPGRFQKLGSKVVKASGAIITPVAVKVLTDYASSHLAELAKIVMSAFHHGQ